MKKDDIFWKQKRAVPIRFFAKFLDTKNHSGIIKSSQKITDLLKFVCPPEATNENSVAGSLIFRACTGFDGGFEVREAIRRLLDCVPTGN